MAEDVVNNVNVTQQTSAFQQVLDAIEALSMEDQITLITVMQQRLQQHKRQELKQAILASEHDYETGNFKRGTVDDVMAELDNE